MRTKANFHGPAFGGLETKEPLSDTQIDMRAQELLGQLTLDEKIKMMSGDIPFWPSLGSRFCSTFGYSRGALRRWPAGSHHGWRHDLPGFYGPWGYL
jgi:hypothetical protein